MCVCVCVMDWTRTLHILSILPLGYIPGPWLSLQFQNCTWYTVETLETFTLKDLFTNKGSSDSVWCLLDGPPNAELCSRLLGNLVWKEWMRTWRIDIVLLIPTHLGGLPLRLSIFNYTYNNHHFFTEYCFVLITYLAVLHPLTHLFCGILLFSPLLRWRT